MKQKKKKDRYFWTFSEIFWQLYVHGKSLLRSTKNMAYGHDSKSRTRYDIQSVTM